MSSSRKDGPSSRSRSPRGIRQLICTAEIDAAIAKVRCHNHCSEVEALAKAADDAAREAAAAAEAAAKAAAAAAKAATAAAKALQNARVLKTHVSNVSQLVTAVDELHNEEQ